MQRDIPFFDSPELSHSNSAVYCAKQCCELLSDPLREELEPILEALFELNMAKEGELPDELVNALDMNDERVELSELFEQTYSKIPKAYRRAEHILMAWDSTGGDSGRFYDWLQQVNLNWDRRYQFPVDRDFLIAADREFASPFITEARYYSVFRDIFTALTSLILYDHEAQQRNEGAQYLYAEFLKRIGYSEFVVNRLNAFFELLSEKARLESSNLDGDKIGKLRKQLDTLLASDWVLSPLRLPVMNSVAISLEDQVGFAFDFEDDVAELDVMAVEKAEVDTAPTELQDKIPFIIREALELREGDVLVSHLTEIFTLDTLACLNNTTHVVGGKDESKGWFWQQQVRELQRLLKRLDLALAPADFLVALTNRVIPDYEGKFGQSHVVIKTLALLAREYYPNDWKALLKIANNDRYSEQVDRHLRYIFQSYNHLNDPELASFLESPANSEYKDREYSDSESENHTDSTAKEQTYPSKSPGEVGLGQLARNLIEQNDPKAWKRDFEDWIKRPYAAQFRKIVVDELKFMIEREPTPERVACVIRFVDFASKNSKNEVFADALPSNCRALPTEPVVPRQPPPTAFPNGELVPEGYFDKTRVDTGLWEGVRDSDLLTNLEKRSTSDPELYLLFTTTFSGCMPWTFSCLSAEAAVETQRKCLALTRSFGHDRDGDWSMRDYKSVIEQLCKLNQRSSVLKSLLVTQKYVKAGSFDTAVRVRWNLNWGDGQENTKPSNEELINWLLASELVASTTRQVRRTQVLEQLCNTLCEFCISQLECRKKTKLSAAGYTQEQCKEPNTHWRRGFLNALAELSLDPNKKAHRIAHFVGEHDFDHETRKLAKRVHDKLCRRQQQRTDVEIQRSYLAALWWLRLARADAAGLDVDYTKAANWRRRELRFVR